MTTTNFDIYNQRLILVIFQLLIYIFDPMLLQSKHLLQVLASKDLMVSLIEKLLTDILNDTSSSARGNSIFHCRQEVPQIPIGNYLKRILKFANCSNSIFVMSLVYIDRLQQSIQGFVLNHYCVHRLLISTIMIAAKFADDFFYKNEFYAKIGGISKIEMNVLELELLKNLNYHLYIEQKELMMYLDRLSCYQDVNQSL